MLNEMPVLANSVCLLALSRSGRHVLALLLCAGLISPCCAMFAIDARRHACKYKQIAGRLLSAFISYTVDHGTATRDRGNCTVTLPRQSAATVCLVQ